VGFIHDGYAHENGATPCASLLAKLKSAAKPDARVIVDVFREQARSSFPFWSDRDACFYRGSPANRFPAGGKAETLAQILAYEDEILGSGAQLVVMPEALLGGYPKGESFGTQLGYRLPEGAKPLPATLPTLSTCRAPKPTHWPLCLHVPGPAWYWA
jgi:hypothetical protein